MCLQYACPNKYISFEIISDVYLYRDFRCSRTLVVNAVDK